MIRATLLVLAALTSIGLAYACGLWALFAVFAAVLTTVLFSSQEVRDTDLDADSDAGRASASPVRPSTTRPAKL